MNEIAVIKQLPIITEQIKRVGEELDERLESLNLNNLVCSEESKQEIKDLRSTLSKEFQEFETQRKEIKNKIMEPYEIFNQTYKEEIESRYQNADEILKNKIDEVESEIKHKTEEKMQQFFEEYKKSKSIIQDNYLEFHELEMKVNLNLLSNKGELVKKVKDEIKQKVDTISNELETISTMAHQEEIMVEYLKHKNLYQAIKEVNDRYVALEKVQKHQEEVKEIQEQENTVIEKVDEVLQAPVVEETIEGQMTIDDFESADEIYEITFKVRGSLSNLREVKQFLENGGYDYESITD